MAGLMFTAGETVTRLRAPLVADRYSGVASEPDWSSPSRLSMPGVGFDPGGSQEPTQDGRSSVVTQPTVYSPKVYDVTAGDRIVARGVTYDVQGRPAEWRNPFTGWRPGQVIVLRAVEN